MTIDVVAAKPKFEIDANLVRREFIESLRELPNPLNQIAEFTFYRTYSRYMDDKGRRETWLEAAVRAAEYSVGLAIKQLKKSGKWNEEVHMPKMVQEAETLALYQYNTWAFVSGRTLYTGGSKAAELYPLSNFNCSSAVIDDYKKIGEMFYLLMVGTGFGFRILEEDVAKLPPVRQDFKITHKPYVAKSKFDRIEKTELSIETTEKGEIAFITIGDSKEGWRASIDLFFELITKEEYKNVKGIVFNYDNIRPKGERLRTFGGTASGPSSMQNMFTTIDKVLHDELDERIKPIKNGVLRPIHVMDIANAVAYNVVSGGVRRSAQICLFSPDDLEVLFAKYGLNGLFGHESKDNYEYLQSLGFELPELEWETTQDWQTGEEIPMVAGREHLNHRRMSNNSALFYKKPDEKTLHMIVRLLKTEGEPGFINGEEALRRFPDFKGVNPCVEILLDDRGLCNLSTIPVINHVQDGVLNRETLLEAARISARIGVRMTTIELELPEWDEVQKKHRLTGCSMTGWQDMLEATGMTDAEETLLLAELKRVTKEESYEYADFLGVPRPANVTAIKPEGTQSLLAGGVSSGLHVAHAPHYFRRVRVSATDPLLQAVEAMGWKTENEIGQGITYTDPTTGEEVTTEVSTKVVTFPLSSPSKRTKNDITVEEQFDTYFKFQEHYTDQNTSNTITVKPHEWDTVESVLWDRWDDMLAVSFLSLDGGTYQLAPYETVDKETHDEALENMPAFDARILEQFETREEFDLEDAAACEGGACPIR